MTAECGDTKTANNVVFDFEGTFTSDDPFAGRTYDRFGVAEKLTLDFTTTPAGITAAQAGGLKWTKVGGVGGALTNNGNDGKGDYDCGDVATTETFKLTVQSGPSKNKQKSYDKQIVAPSGVHMAAPAPGDVRFAAAPLEGVEFLAYYYLEPKDVSFKNLTYGEGSCPADPHEGYFARNYTPAQLTHPENVFGTIEPGNITTGCRTTLQDNPKSFNVGPFSDGRYSWAIPQRYRKGAGGTWRVITTLTHEVTIARWSRPVRKQVTLLPPIIQ